MSHVPWVGAGTVIELTELGPVTNWEPNPCLQHCTRLNITLSLFPFIRIFRAKIPLLGSFRSDVYRKEYVLTQYLCSSWCLEFSFLNSCCRWSNILNKIRSYLFSVEANAASILQNHCDLEAKPRHLQLITEQFYSHHSEPDTTLCLCTERPRRTQSISFPTCSYISHTHEHAKSNQVCGWFGMELDCGRRKGKGSSWGLKGELRKDDVE